MCAFIQYVFCIQYGCFKYSRCDLHTVCVFYIQYVVYIQYVWFTYSMCVLYTYIRYKCLHTVCVLYIQCVCVIYRQNVQLYWIRKIQLMFWNLNNLYIVLSILLLLPFKHNVHILCVCMSTYKTKPLCI